MRKVTMIGDCRLFGQQRREAEPRHASSENLRIATVAGAATGNAALALMFIEGAVESGDNLRGRSVDGPLTIGLEAPPLVEQIEAEGRSVARRPLQPVAFDDREGNAGDPLQTFVLLATNAAKRVSRASSGSAPECAHCVDDQRPAVVRAYLRHLLDRIEHAGGGLAVNRRNMGDPAIGTERPLQPVRRDRLHLGPMQGGDAASDHAGDRRHAASVGAVDQHQELARRRQQRADRRLDRERSAALQRNADMRPIPTGQSCQTPAQPPGHLDELGIAGSPVPQHRRLDGRRGGERAGRQQDRIGRCTGIGHLLPPGHRLAPPTRPRSRLPTGHGQSPRWRK